MCFVDRAGPKARGFPCSFPGTRENAPSRQGTSAAAKQAPDAAGDPETKETGDRLRLRIISMTFDRLERASSGGSCMLAVRERFAYAAGLPLPVPAAERLRPAGAGFLPTAGDGERVRLYVLGDHRARTDIGAVADPDRG